MTERKIIRIGDPVLRAVCKSIPRITPHIIKLLKDLTDTLYAIPWSKGLAAPQIGISKRVAVLDCGEGLIELINPEIIEQKGKQQGTETCLSIPGVFGEVKRAKYVKVKTLNRAGEEIVIEKEGFTAVCLQHEIDHLNGVLFIDRVEANKLFNEMTLQTVDPLAMVKFSKEKILGK